MHQNGKPLGSVPTWLCRRNISASFLWYSYLSRTSGSGGIFTPFLPCEKISGVFCTSRIGVSSVSCKITGDPSFILVTASHQLGRTRPPGHKNSDVQATLFSSCSCCRSRWKTSCDPLKHGEMKHGLGLNTFQTSRHTAILYVCFYCHGFWEIDFSTFAVLFSRPYSQKHTPLPEKLHLPRKESKT